MKLVEMKCKNCGAPLKVEENSKEVKCNYCKTQYKLDDEVKHIKYDDMEQAGYEFEKGRIKAQMEKVEIKPEEINKKKNNTLLILGWIFLFPFMLIYVILTSKKLSKEQKNKALWILGWIFCFPIPLTILIWKSKLSKAIKITLTILLFALVLIIGGLLPEEPIESPSDSDINEVGKNNKVNDDINQSNEDTTNNAIEEKKTYKLNSKEYVEYVTSIFQDMTQKYPEFYLQNRTTYSGIYLRMHLYPRKKISQEEYDRVTNSICNEVYNELKKNNYKSGGFFAYDYEFLDIYFFSPDELHPGQYDRDEVQIKIYDIEKYTNYDEYKESKKLKY